MRSAVHRGLWYGTDSTPVPSLMLRVRSRAAAAEDHRVGDDFGPAGMMFTDPRFVEAQVVEMTDQLEITVEVGVWIRAMVVKWRLKSAKFESLHERDPLDLYVVLTGG